MKSLRELYTVGRGPSSSHTIGPTRACCLFREEHPDADRYEVALFGSLALTGRGHLTDVAVRDALAPVHTDILWNTERTDLPHPNTMELRAYKNGALTGEMTALSVGGGAIVVNKIDSINVNFTGEFNTLIVRNQDESGSVAAITSILSQLRINVANMSVNRHRRGGDALMVIETDQHIKRNQVDFLAQLPGILSVTYYDKEDDEDGSGFDEANL